MSSNRIINEFYMSVLSPNRIMNEFYISVLSPNRILLCRCVPLSFSLIHSLKYKKNQYYLNYTRSIKVLSNYLIIKYNNTAFVFMPIFTISNREKIKKSVSVYSNPSVHLRVIVLHVREATACII